MTTLMILRMKGDAKKLEALVAKDPERLSTISHRGEKAGALRHRFYATGDEIIVVDEWPDQASFQKFFDNSPDIQELMAEVGITSEPQVLFAEELSTGDAIG